MDTTNCACWFDAADPTTLTLLGSNVLQWRSKVGSNRVLQPDIVISNAPPEYIQSSRAVYFDNGPEQDSSVYPGVQGLVTSSFFDVSSANTSVYIVANLLDGLSTNYNIGFGISTARTPSFFYGIHLNREDPDGQRNIESTFGGSMAYSSNALPVFSPFVSSWTAGFTAPTTFQQEFYVNSVLQASKTNTATPTSPLTPVFVGMSSSSITGNRTFTGYIHEVLYYTVKHTPAQRQAIETYLANKWLVRPQVQQSFLLYQYLPVTPIPVAAEGVGQVDLFIDPDTLPPGLQFDANTITGAPTQLGTTTVIVYARDDRGTTTLPLTFTVLVPRILKKQDGAGAYTSLLRQYTEVNAAQNSVNNLVYPNQEQKLGVFMAPDAPSVTKDVVPPNCFNPNSCP